jgi:hypothetical protein
MLDEDICAATNWEDNIGFMYAPGVYDRACDNVHFTGIIPGDRLQ